MDKLFDLSFVVCKKRQLNLCTLVCQTTNRILNFEIFLRAIYDWFPVWAAGSVIQIILKHNNQKMKHWPTGGGGHGQKVKFGEAHKLILNTDGIKWVVMSDSSRVRGTDLRLMAAETAFTIPCEVTEFDQVNHGWLRGSQYIRTQI